MERLTLQPGAAAAVDEYLEYKRIVGEDDGGKLFTPEEYEKYKKKVLPIRLQNRLFVSWRSPTGMDCKLVGPETPCFCTHRYKQHKTDFEEIPKERPISLPCRVGHCPCKSYNFIPLNGTQPIRCRCKHFADQHSAAPGFPCNTCSKCSGFHSCFTCGCGQPTYAHETVVETKEERLAQGKPVGQDVPYAAMGGLTGFSSLAEGYMRLDDSGIGAPSIEFLESPVTNVDHPFLRALQGPSSSTQARPQLTDVGVGQFFADSSYPKLTLTPTPQLRLRLHSPGQQEGGASTAMQVALRRPDEDDMAYFERQYQERLKQEKAAAKQKGKHPVTKNS